MCYGVQMVIFRVIRVEKSGISVVSVWFLEILLSWCYHDTSTSEYFSPISDVQYSYGLHRLFLITIPLSSSSFLQICAIRRDSMSISSAISLALQNSFLLLFGSFLQYETNSQPL